MTEFLNNHKLLSKQQFGFRSKRSTELAATLFTDDIRKFVDHKKVVGSVFIDSYRKNSYRNFQHMVEQVLNYSGFPITCSTGNK